MSAISCNAFISPSSLPNESMTSPFIRFAIFTPPNAKYFAVVNTYCGGSSTTISTPFLTAHVALVYLSDTAHSPRWVKLPLITHTTLSAPVSDFARDK